MKSGFIEDHPFAQGRGNERIGHLAPLGHLLRRPHQDVLGRRQADQRATVARRAAVARLVRRLSCAYLAAATPASVRLVQTS